MYIYKGLLKDKLRHLKMLSLFELNSISIGQHHIRGG